MTERARNGGFWFNLIGFFAIYILFMINGGSNKEFFLLLMISILSVIVLYVVVISILRIKERLTK
ncbi:hypothetical protein D5F11_023050 [Siminovitchia terrae]|uniref:Uncharacterized protein n=1 Tax=Siminovitchia terrae TaxID=1914933 RepID=A0A429X2J7_SIMTE|nr:hypothetical protein [Siminovitchia terrae]RST57390.1 hypothetical protein D5F11_023050 [Siminovitchia terrae]